MFIGKIAAATSLALAAVVPSQTLAAETSTSCKTVFDAIAKQVMTPNHEFMIQTVGADNAKREQREVINTGTAQYFLVGGEWHTMKETPKDTLQRERENEASSDVTCRYLRDESVEGVSTTVFSEHSKTETGESNALIWIAKGNAMPVREQVDMDPGNPGARHLEVRIVYSNVQAPSGVKP
jgi:hypothetical protein